VAIQRRALRQCGVLDPGAPPAAPPSSSRAPQAQAQAQGQALRSRRASALDVLAEFMHRRKLRSTDLFERFDRWEREPLESR
jgi:hypothetical protein